MCDPHIEHIDDYLALADAAGGPIGHIFETHLQADHLSGAQALAQRTRARIYLHEAAGVRFPHVDLRDGDEIELGNDYVRVLHTPGHTPESVCYVVGDRTRGEDPWLVLTGDTLFVGSVGRPDLLGDDAADALAGELYRSLVGKLLTLHDTVEVYPAHFAGSACGAGLSAKPSSTIGFERRFNQALQCRSQEDFIRFVTSHLPPPPAEFDRIRQVNRSEDLAGRS